MNSHIKTLAGNQMGRFWFERKTKHSLLNTLCWLSNSLLKTSVTRIDNQLLLFGHGSLMMVWLRQSWLYFRNNNGSFKISIFLQSLRKLIGRHFSSRKEANVWIALLSLQCFSWCLSLNASIPPMKNRSGTNACLKNRSNERVYLKSDQLLLLYIAVDRLKRSLSLDWFLKHTLWLDRFFIEGIGMSLLMFQKNEINNDKKTRSTYLRSCEYDRFRQILEHEGESAWGICHGIRAMEDDKTVILVVHCLKDRWQ